MRLHTDLRVITLAGLLAGLGIGCGDNTPVTSTDSGNTPVDVASDTGTDAGPARDVSDAGQTDATTTDAPATDTPATDTPATDTPATDAPATDTPATDAGPADTGATDASTADVSGGDVATTDATTSDSGAVDAGPADVATTDTGAVDAGPADVATTDVSSADAGSADAGATDGGMSLRELCTSTGGTVGTTMCCSSVSDFPNQCTVGACGCAPSSSRAVMTCTCPGTPARMGCFDPGVGCRVM